ncbi:MAG: ABC transporter ATP-binding protein [Alphaproteobacteria bacterium]|nr:MAG: ABC transporter ATP-binding protein [Alphaproteobacteria bacterium]
MLCVRDIKASYGKVMALRGVTLDVGRGDLVCLVGANGAGKTTLMKVIMGLVPAVSGTVDFRGRALLGMRTHDIAQLGIAYVPEGRGTLRELSVRENLRLGAFSRRWDAETKGDLERVLERFPFLAERIHQTAGTLSGGEQQMLVIGRALMSRPQLMLLDEPSLGLAPLVAARIFEIITALNAQGVAVLLVEQNARAALKLAKRGYVIELGRTVLEGENLSENKRVLTAYLGDFIAPR